MDAVTSFYERLITNPSPIEPVLQVRIVEHLVREKEFASLGKFAARVDLSAEAEARIVARDEAQVLAGWAARPGRTHAEIIGRLGNEKRVTTLLPLAKMQGLPSEIYVEIAKRSSVKLTEALMTNPSVPEEIKLARIVEIASLLDSRRHWYVGQAVAEFAGSSDTLRLALAAHSCSPSVLMAVLPEGGVDLPAGMTEALVGRIARITELHAEDSSLGSLFVRLSLQDLAPEQLKTLRPLVNGLVKAAKDSYSYWNNTGFDTAKHLLSEKGRKHATQIRGLAVSTDADESQKLLRELLGSSKTSVKLPYKEAVFAAVAVNQVLPAQAVKPLLEEFVGSDEQRLFATWCARGEVQALAEVALESWGQPDWVDSLADPRPFLEALVALARDKEESLPSWLLSHPVVYHNPETALALLPWQSLHEVSNVPVYGDESNVDLSTRDLVVDAAQRLIAERMGDDHLKWEVFATLAGEFEGTLHELLDAVEAIAV